MFKTATCFGLHTDHTHAHTYLLTPWCRVLLEKLTGLQLVKKFPAFHGTRRFITALTSVRQLSLSWAGPIQSIHPHPISWRSILILSTHLRLGLPSGHAHTIPRTHITEDNAQEVLVIGITQNTTISKQTGMSHSKCNSIKTGPHRTHRLHTKTTC